MLNCNDLFELLRSPMMIEQNYLSILNWWQNITSVEGTRMLSCVWKPGDDGLDLIMVVLWIFLLILSASQIPKWKGYRSSTVLQSGHNSCFSIVFTVIMVNKLIVFPNLHVNCPAELQICVVLHLQWITQGNFSLCMLLTFFFFHVFLLLECNRQIILEAWILGWVVMFS